jgi:D-alanyl-D-alanine carboxypeptidase/D-alanyl-D-alanine-endopeptidase (penicillin-binding protein 4)
VPLTPTPDAPEATAAESPSATGSTRGGARVAMAYARSLGVRVNLVDGSGLSRSDQAAPKQVARLLDRLREEPGFSSLYASLPIAGRDGTLFDRMRRGAARDRCRGKTGTLSNVSALSGYCEAVSGDSYAYSILMNGVYPVGARKLQDLMLQALSRYG